MHRKMFWDVFGMVEQLICVLADVFYGSEFSTFTQWIKFARANGHEQLFPEAKAQWVQHQHHEHAPEKVGTTPPHPHASPTVVSTDESFKSNGDQ
jgi:hypothetical protein